MTFLGFLLINFSLQAGYTPEYTRDFWGETLESRSRFTTDLGFNALAWDVLYLEAHEKVAMVNTGLQWFFPIQGDYTIKAELRLEGFEVGVEHECIHPILSSVLPDGFSGGQTELFIRFDTKGAKR